MDNLESLRKMHQDLSRSATRNPIAGLDMEDVTLLLSCLMEILERLRNPPILVQEQRLANDATETDTETSTTPDSGSTCGPTGPERKSLVEMVEESNRRPVSGWDDKGQRQKGKT